MSVFFALFKKHAIESRWVLAILAAALFAMGILWTWGVSRAEKLIEQGGMDRRLGFYRGLGGAEMDFTPGAMEATVWNHPVVILMILGWTISRGSAAVASEIERGTLDLTLSRPVPRALYLASQVSFALSGAVVLAAAVVAGELVGWQVFHLSGRPAATIFLRPAALYVALGAAVYGYTLPFSAADSVRWRSSGMGAAVTLGGLICMFLSRQLNGYDWLEKLSVLYAYAPVTAAMKGDPLTYNSTVLAAVCAAGLAISFFWFANRDLPANA